MALFCVPKNQMIYLHLKGKTEACRGGVDFNVLARKKVLVSYIESRSSLSDYSRL